MANGISRASVYEALQAATDGNRLDLWEMARYLADDVESWGEDDFFAAQPSNRDGPPAPRYWTVSAI